MREAVPIARERLGIVSHELRQALNAALTAERLVAVSVDGEAAIQPS